MIEMDKFRHMLDSYEAALASMGSIRVAEQELMQRRLQAQCRIDETRLKLTEFYAAKLPLQKEMV